MLPADFSRRARSEFTDCPFPTEGESPDSPHKRGDIVDVQNVVGKEDRFCHHQKVRAVVVGFLKPSGFAGVIDQKGRWLTVHPAALSQVIRGS